MNWFTRLFARKPIAAQTSEARVVKVPIEVTMRVVDGVAENPFQSLASVLTDGPSTRIQDLESGLLALRERFNNRQLLLFKALCVLYANDEKLRAEAFQDFIDKVEGDFVNLESHEIDDAKRHMIARGIGHESDVL